MGDFMLGSRQLCKTLTFICILFATITIGCIRYKSTVPRIVAIGDLHADLDHTIKVLQLAKLIDQHKKWIGGNSIVVQTGDLTDRGPDGKNLLEFIRTIERESQQAGGQFITLLGNHEAMNLMGDWRYVSPQDIRSFGSKEQRIQAFSSSGEWRTWILEHDAVAQIEDIIFVHGGVSLAYADKSAAELSQEIRTALKQQKNHPILGSEGPLWYRGYLLADETIACKELEKTLAKRKAKRMIVGHTTQRSGKVAVRCGGKLLGIDIGISAHYGANLGYVEIKSGDAKAYYVFGAEDIPDP